jgi:PAS domain S-box-containing protein
LLVAMSVMLGLGQRSSAQKDRDEQLAQIADRQVQTLTHYFERARTVNLLVARDPAFKSVLELPGPLRERIAAGGGVINEGADALAYLQQLFPASIAEACLIHVSGLEVTRVVRGERAATVDLSPDESGSPFFGPTFRLAEGEVYQAQPYVSPDTHEWVISNSTLVPSRGGAKQAIAHFEVTLESFRREAAAAAGDHRVLIVDRRTDRVVVDTARPRPAGQILPAATGIWPRDVSIDPSHATTADTAGGRTLYRHVGTGTGNANDWYVVVRPNPGAAEPGVGAASLGMGFAALLLLGLGLVSSRTLNRQRRTADREMERSVSLLQATLESTADGILVVDQQDEIVGFNHRFLEMWGLQADAVSPGDMVGVLSSLPEQLSDQDAFRARMSTLYADPGAESSDVLEFRDGRVFERLLRPQLMAGQPVGRVWSFHDVTERAQTEQRLREANEMKNSFLSAVSHELRTPLTSILGFSQTLIEFGDTVPLEQRNDMLERVSRNAERLVRLIADLLDVDRLSRGLVKTNPAITDLGRLAVRVAGETEPLMDRGITITGENVLAMVDPAKVERIIENLLHNAVKYTPAGTPIWFTAWRQDDGVVIRVDDAGPGVPAEHREAIFEPFRQGPGTPTHAPGVGVGLSLVVRFAELHGGHAWVEDRPGGGASFRVFLRDGGLAPAPAAAPVVPPVPVV